VCGGCVEVAAAAAAAAANSLAPVRWVVGG